MKKTTKIISVVLVLVMMLSTVAPAYAGTLNVTSSTTIESLLAPAKDPSKDTRYLAKLVDSVLTDLNASKTNITGTVLRLCFLFIEEESLQNAIGTTDVVSASDAALAKILVGWLNTQLPVWTKDITEQDWYSTASSLVGVLGLTLDLKSVNGVLETLYSVCNKLSSDIIFKNLDGDLSKLNGSAIKSVRYNNDEQSALNVVYALFQFLADNKGLLSSVVNNGIGRSGGLSLGSIFDDVLGDSLDSVNTLIDNLPDFAKSYIYLLIDGYAEAGDINGETEAEVKGTWGTSAYKNFTADELLAAAVIRLIRKADVSDTISQSDAQAALNKSFYELLSENLEPLFVNYDVAAWLNKVVNNAVDKLSAFPEIKKIFNSNISFTNSTFSDIFAGAKTSGIVAQLNTLLYKVAELALTSTEFAKLGFEKGDNTKLNANLTKLCAYVLPMLATEEVSDSLGFDFTSFTAENVKNLSLKEMATAVLKLFYETWFGENKNYSAEKVAAAGSIAELAELAVYYTATNTDWLTLEGVTITAPDAKVDATDYILNTASLIALGSLNGNSDYNYFKTSVTGANGYTEVIDEISDWGLNFVKGIPAVVAEAGLSTTRNKVDDQTKKYGAFYKLNVVLNELIDFSFLTNDNNNTTFKFDIGMFLTDTVLDNLYNFDIESILKVFQKNDSATNSLNKKNVVNSVLQIVDRLVTSLFKHTGCTKKTITVTSKDTCTEKEQVTYTYCEENGHYLEDPVTKTLAAKGHTWKTIEKVAKGATCTEYGYEIRECTVCGENTGKVFNTATGNHTYEMVVKEEATCQKEGLRVETCTVCGKTTGITQTIEKVDHIYENGKCKWCGQTEAPAYVLGDVDGDGSIKSADARLALRASVGITGDKDVNGNDIDFSDKTSSAFLAADYNCDKQITSADARSILRVSVGLSAE